MSFVTEHISNPVTLRKFNFLQRSKLLEIGSFAIFGIGFIFPMLIFLNRHWQDQGDPYNLMRNLEGLAEFGIFCNTVLMFIVPLLMLGILLDHTSPQKEFIQHGKLKPLTLTQGTHRWAWMIFAWVQLLSLPLMFAITWMGSPLADTYFIHKAATIVVGLLLIEFMMPAVGRGVAGVLMSVITIFSIPFALILFDMEKYSNVFLDFLLEGRMRTVDATLYVTEWPGQVWAGIVCVGVVLAGWLRSANFTALQPKHSNREKPFRLVTLAAMAGLGVVLSGLAIHFQDWRLLKLWSHLAVAVAVVIFASGLKTHSLPGRVRREIPANPLKRWIAYPFTSGIDSALIWSSGLIALVLTLTTIALPHAGGHWNHQAITCVWRPLTFWLIIVAFGLQAIVYLQHFGGPNPKYTKAISRFAQKAIGGVVCSLALAYLVVSEFESTAYKMLSNPWIIVGLPAAAVIIQTIRTRKWWIRRWREFQPMENK